MRLLYRSILYEVSITFLVTFLTLGMIMFLGNAMQLVARFEDFGFDFALSLLKYIPPLVASAALPLAILVGAALSYSRLILDNEFIAIRSAGIPTRRILYPAALLGILVALVALTNLTFFEPRARELMGKAKNVFIREEILNKLPEGPWAQRFGTVALSYRHFEGGVFEDFQMTKLKFDDENLARSKTEVYIHADKAWLTFDEATATLSVDVADGFIHRPARQTGGKIPADNHVFYRGRAFGHKLVISELASEGQKTLVGLTSFEIADELARRRSAENEDAESGLEHIGAFAMVFTNHVRLSKAIAIIPLALLGALIPLAICKRNRFLLYAAAILPPSLGYFFCAALLKVLTEGAVRTDMAQKSFSTLFLRFYLPCWSTVILLFLTAWIIWLYLRRR
ncbi:MAG: LptF/LptG family permease [Planctomycetes bacterium]|nr:LptF/LptG family permease [Planctomycetota bacterium]